MPDMVGVAWHIISPRAVEWLYFGIHAPTFCSKLPLLCAETASDIGTVLIKCAFYAIKDGVDLHRAWQTTIKGPIVSSLMYVSKHTIGNMVNMYTPVHRHACFDYSAG